MKRFVVFLALCLSVPAFAQDREVPYWASISADEANMRAGAGEIYPIEWVYSRPGLPLKVKRYVPGWRYVEEPDGTEGWMYVGLLSDTRTAIVVGEELVPMRERGESTAPLRWNLEPGVIGALGDCSGGWCSFDVEGRTGWVQQDRLWGAGEP